MTFEESIPLAKELAENQLKKGFDVEAFLILCELSKLDNLDLVPDSNVDEMITDIGSFFLQYSRNKTSQNLNNVLDMVVRMLGELYYSCESAQDKELFKLLPNKLADVFKQTIIQ
nr:MAG TPA: hypothetical protein [Caudoviricetes sp.]